MNQATMNARKVLIKRLFVLLLTGLLLLPNSNVNALDVEDVDVTEILEDTESIEDVGFPEGTEFVEEVWLPEGLDPAEATSVTAQKVSYMTAKSVTSIDPDNLSRTEILPTLYAGGKSMWFTDNKSVTQIVRTHNDKSHTHLPGKKVEIIIYQEGVGSAYTRVDGRNCGVHTETLALFFQTGPRAYPQISDKPG